MLSNEPHSSPNPPSVLDALGIVGWRSREPIVLAALATEEPLLLVGPHGAAKSLLLERLAEAMALRLRHYNASILNFDDLIGFPVPDGDAVRYLRTPCDAWEAEAIFVDELSRCRPDMQNRLLPLIHERRLQGRRLDALRFRWSAMNPPPPPDADPEDERYVGAEPLDAALADRFAFIVDVPALPTGEDRLRLIRGPVVADDASVLLRDAVATVRGALRTVEQVHGEAVARYVDVVGEVLDRAHLPLSGRRLRFLYRNILSVAATPTVEGIEDAALLALTWSLPQRASGRVDDEALVRAHHAALRVLDAPMATSQRELLRERDPVLRVRIALGDHDDDLLAATMLDARASLGTAQRLALSSRLFPIVVATRPRVPAVALEALAEDVAKLNRVVERNESVATADPQYQRAGEIARAISRLAEQDRWIAEVLWAAWEEGFDSSADAVVSFARSTAEALAPFRRAA